VNRRESDDEVLGDGNDVGAAIAQWRYHDRENAQAEEKIFTKMARGDSGLEIGVGKSDQAGLNTKSFGPAETLEGALLKDAQEFALRFRRERGDFIEDDGSFAAEFEAAEFAFDRSGEGASLVAEEFALDEMRRQRSAINLRNGASRRGLSSWTKRAK